MFCCGGALEAQRADTRAAANTTKQAARFRARDVRRLMRGGGGLVEQRGGRLQAAAGSVARCNGGV